MAPRPLAENILYFCQYSVLDYALFDRVFLLFSENSHINHSDESLYTKPRKSSTSSTSSSSTGGGISNHLSASNPDLSLLGGLTVPDSAGDYPDHVVKVYRADQSFKYLPIHKVSMCCVQYTVMGK